ncbi:MAG: pyridoxal phosphate-dependent aminotransferase [Bryobacteraceae bacterium]
MHGESLFAISRTRGWDWRAVLDLSASINPLGPPPGVRPAIQAALDRIACYPAPMPLELESALAAAWRVAPEMVLAGGGATELLHFFARVGWHGPAALVTPVWPAFYRAFPHALHLPLDDPYCWPQRGLLALGQPVNPTGEEIPANILRRAIASREGPVLVDESFIDFTPLDSAVAWCADHPNLLVLRSLSGFYALPGLRVGALVGSPQSIARLRRRREPFTVGVLAAAAALAALADADYPAHSRALIAAERGWLLEQLGALDGLQLTPGAANFLFASTARPAQQVVDWFLDRQILLHNCTGQPGIPGQAIRFAIRTRPENERFVAAAREFFCAADQPVVETP